MIETFRGRRVLTAVALSGAVFLVASPVFAGAPTERLRSLFAQVDAILADPATEGQPLERVVRVRRLIADVADIRAAAAAALGPEWERRTAAERDEFVTLFGDLIERAYVGRLAGAVRMTGGLEVRYSDEVVTGNEATVTTALSAGGGHDLRVEYRMAARDGRWRVRDIVLDGVSTVENYHAQFRRVLEHGGYAALTAQLRDRVRAESRMFVRVEPRPVPPPVEVTALPAPEPAAPPREIATPRGLVEPPPEVKPSRRETASTARRAPPVVAPVAAPPPRAAQAAQPSSPPRVAQAAQPSSPPRVAPAPLPSPPARVATSTRATSTTSAAVVTAAAASVPEPGALGMALGATLLGLVGMGGAALLRRLARRTRRRSGEQVVDGDDDLREREARHGAAAADVARVPVGVAGRRTEHVHTFLSDVGEPVLRDPRARVEPRLHDPVEARGRLRDLHRK
jgi:ABC-type transporter MlaC component